MKIQLLSSPVHAGDWHDKPLRWEVTDGILRQLFSTKAQARWFGAAWRRLGFHGALDAFATLPLEHRIFLTRARGSK